MKQTNDFEDKILDNLLTDAMDDLYPNFEDFSPEDYDEPSERFQTSMENLFQEEERKLKRKAFYLKMPRIASVLALFLIVALITVNTTSAWKEPLYNFFFKNSSDSQVSKVDIVENNSAEKTDKYLPAYVPEGFKLTLNEYIEELEQYNFRYEKQNLFFSITIVPDEDDLYTNLSSFEKIKHNNITYYINNKNKIIWNYDDHYFSMTSNLNQSDMLKISNSIK